MANTLVSQLTSALVVLGLAATTMIVAPAVARSAVDRFEQTAAQRILERQTPVAVERPAPKEVIEQMHLAKRHSVVVFARDASVAVKGTGFVLRRFGDLAVVATNAHVILDEHHQPMRDHTVRNADGVSLAAYPLWWSTDGGDDHALLAVRDPDNALGEASPLAAPEEGAFVVCVGSPLEEQLLVTEGTVGSVVAGTFGHGCVSEHGSSGGPVFDRLGRVVGMQTYLGHDGRGWAVTLEPFTQLTMARLRVRADRGWQELPLHFDASRPVVVTGLGSWTYSRWYQGVTGAGTNDPDLGEYSVTTEAPHAALLCAVGADGAVVGVTGRFRNSGAGSTTLAAWTPSTSGTLRCRINDRDLGNNSGELDLLAVQRL